MFQQSQASIRYIDFDDMLARSLEIKKMVKHGGITPLEKGMLRFHPPILPPILNDEACIAATYNHTN